MSDSNNTIIADRNRFAEKDFERKVPTLTYLTGKQVGRRIMLADDRITLGRAPDATIMLTDTHVSRLHLSIEFDHEHHSYLIRDLKSSNGTFLNGVRIFETHLKESDKILIGKTILRFGWSDAFDLRYQTEIDNLLNIDAPTGLIIKRRFDEELDRYIAVARTQGADLILMVMDMDEVKELNDTHGHAFGSHAISQAGRLVRAAVEHRGLASRLGGDEFVALLPNMPMDTATEIAESIRSQIQSYPFEKDGRSFSPTISIGITDFRIGDTTASLFKRAEDALLQSKQTGRNKVSVSDRMG